MLSHKLFGWMKMKSDKPQWKKSSAEYVEQPVASPTLKTSQSFISNKKTTIEFEHGLLIKINGKQAYIDKPSTYDLSKVYVAERYIIDGHQYDLTKLQDIQRIPVVYTGERSSVSSPVFDLPYILRMGGKALFDKGMQENCFECLRKAIAIYEHTDDTYSLKSTIIELQKHMLAAGKVDAAESEYRTTNKKYDYTTDEIASARLTFKYTLNNAKELETDLLFLPNETDCCAECAKYRNRVFSISGNSKDYPKLPDSVFKYGGIHKGCRCSFYPYQEQYDYHQLGMSKKAAIKRSNRPFIDDRTPDEVQAYNEYYELKQKEQSKNNDRIEYYKILQKYPDKAPKSFGAYRMMKNKNTKNYQKLVEFLKENNFYT